MTSGSSQNRARTDELADLPAEDRLQRLSEWGAVEEVLLDLSDDAATLAATNSTEADSVTKLLVGLADQACLPLAQVRVRRARVRALAYGSRYDEALALCRETIGMAENADLLEEAGRTRLASMHPLTELGRLADAIETGNMARMAFLEMNEPRLAARADVNLGVAYQRSDQLDRAIACFDRARPALAREPLTRGHLDNNRGEALLALNDFQGAEQAFVDARCAFEEAGADLTAAIAEGNLADLAVRQGRLSRGLKFFELARRRLESAGSPSHLARLIAEQAEAKALVGMSNEALQEYGAALRDLQRCQLPLEAARARAGMGKLLLRFHRWAEAETALAAAATGFDELGHRTARAKVDLVRAELLAATGRRSDARSLTLRSLAVLEERPADAIAARHLLARISAAAGDLDLAEAELAVALTAAQSLDLAPALADLWHTRGLVDRQRGRIAAAQRGLTRAVEQVERVRGTLQAERFRTAYLGERSTLFEDLVATLLEDDGGEDIVDRAFATVERCKSRALLDQLQTVIDLDPGGVGDQVTDEAECTLIRRLGSVRAELSALYSRLGDERVSRHDAASARTWRESIHRLEDELEGLESRLESARGTAGLYAPSLELPALQDVLDDQTLLIEYYIVDRELLAFVIGRDRALIRRGLASVDDITNRLERLHFQIDRALRPGSMKPRRAPRLLADVRRELQALHGLLLEPLANQLADARRLVIVPHGPLHALPFSALYDGRRHLVETHEIEIAPSASLYVHLARETSGSRSPDGDVLVVGVPDEIATGIVREAELVARTLSPRPVRLLVGPEADSRQFAIHAPDCSILHLACHGRFENEHPRASGLRLADRWFGLQDICALRLKADLVTLSACESGLNRVAAGDELTGLFRGLLAAGARSVLGSLWRVDDDSAAAFMPAFYESWARGPQSSGSAALREAQLALMAQRPHPAFWAPFILIGGAP